jgi:hypothetical protein
MLRWRIDTRGLITLVHSYGARDPDRGRDQPFSVFSKILRDIASNLKLSARSH